MVCLLEDEPENFFVVYVNRNREKGINFGQPVPFPQEIFQCMNALHFEVLLVHKFVQGFQADYWALFSVFLGNKKEV